MQGIVPTAVHFWDNILQVAGMSYLLEGATCI